jgi:folylpolyglutamate synthase/dihydropteroate synthase
MLRVLLPAVSSFVATRASNARSADPEALADRARTIAQATAPSLEIVAAASLDAALADAWRRSSRIVAAGSIFLLGDVMQQLGLHL